MAQTDYSPEEVARKICNGYTGNYEPVRDLIRESVRQALESQRLELNEAHSVSSVENLTTANANSRLDLLHRLGKWSDQLAISTEVHGDYLNSDYKKGWDNAVKEIKSWIGSKRSQINVTREVSNSSSSSSSSQETGQI